MHLALGRNQRLAVTDMDMKLLSVKRRKLLNDCLIKKDSALRSLLVVKQNTLGHTLFTKFSAC